MFIFNLDSMLDELRENYSGYNALKNLPKIDDTNYMEKLNKLYNECESISIDYTVMEKSNNIYVIPGDFGWDDIGTWMSLLRYINPDEHGNYIKGNVVTYDSNKNIVYAGDKLVQMMLIPVFHTEYEEVNENVYGKIMADSNRGDSGFGSSDIKH